MVSQAQATVSSRKGPLGVGMLALSATVLLCLSGLETAYAPRITEVAETADPAVEAVAYTLYGEARGTSLSDQMGVLAVIRERALRPGWWGDGWREVVMSPWQFTSWHTPDRLHELNRRAMLAAPFADPAGWQNALALAEYAVYHMSDQDVMELFGVGIDEIPTHYHDRSIDTPASWGRAEEIIPPWPSAFRWYVVHEGRPARIPSDTRP